jgi:hypothetical protein
VVDRDDGVEFSGRLTLGPMLAQDDARAQVLLARRARVAVEAVVDGDDIPTARIGGWSARAGPSTTAAAAEVSASDPTCAGRCGTR